MVHHVSEIIRGDGLACQRLQKSPEVSPILIIKSEKIGKYWHAIGHIDRIFPFVILPLPVVT